MVKVIVLLARRTGMSRAEFRAYYEQHHLPLVLRLPGLQRFVVNYPKPDASGAEPAYDAIAEDWFESLDAMHAAMASEAGRAVQEDTASFLDMSKFALLVAEEDPVRI